jgi:hypothetical protein
VHVADAVLLVSDIAADRFPTKCVRTGEPTTRATHIWAVASRHADRVLALFGVLGVVALRAVGKQARRVPIPVAPGPYGIWRRRAAAWAAVTCFGLGLVLVSPLRGGTPLAVFGVVVMALAALLRARAHSGFWVSAELRPAAGHVIVHRAHPAFDAEARTLFLRHLKR